MENSTKIMSSGSGSPATTAAGLTFGQPLTSGSAPRGSFPWIFWESVTSGTTPKAIPFLRMLFALCRWRHWILRSMLLTQAPVRIRCIIAWMKSLLTPLRFLMTPTERNSWSWRMGISIPTGRSPLGKWQSTHWSTTTSPIPWHTRSMWRRRRWAAITPQSSRQSCWRRTPTCRRQAAGTCPSGTVWSWTTWRC